MCTKQAYVQNLIANPSFSEVFPKKDSSSFYTIFPGARSQVKNWYLPEYIDYKLATKGSNSPLYSSTYYYSSRDKEGVIKKKLYSNSDQLFEDNLGFMYIYMNNRFTVSVIQQKFTTSLPKGKYCFKFKYKYLANYSSHDVNVKLEVAFSPTDLKEYYQKQWLNVPLSLTQVSYQDTSIITDKNTPWQQHCSLIELKGNEQYVSIGSLSHPNRYVSGWALYYIDDIEFYKITDTVQCNCYTINKDLSETYAREFPLDRIVSNDTLITFVPNGQFIPGIITPPAKHYLNQIIAFMQRHPDVKILLTEQDRLNIPSSSSGSYSIYFVEYLLFFGISKERIRITTGRCEGGNSIYCGLKAEYVKVSIMFYRS